MNLPLERVNPFIHPHDGTPMTSDEIVEVLEKKMFDGEKYAPDIVRAYCFGLSVGIMLAELKYIEAQLRRAGRD